MLIHLLQGRAAVPEAVLSHPVVAVVVAVVVPIHLAVSEATVAAVLTVVCLRRVVEV